MSECSEFTEGYVPCRSPVFAGLEQGGSVRPVCFRHLMAAMQRDPFAEAHPLPRPVPWPVPVLPRPRA